MSHSKPNYNASDERTAQERERDLLRSAQAEGRPAGENGARPLSEAHPKKMPAGGDLRHIIETGLPPGVDEEDAADPGTRNLGNPPAKNQS